MLDWAIDQDSRPVVIRVPGNGVVSNPDFALDPKAPADFTLPRYDVVHEGSDVAILALGSFFSLGESLCDALSAPADGGPALDATLVNPRFATELDEATLDDLARSHRVIVTLEDGVLEGGWGEKGRSLPGPDQRTGAVLRRAQGLPRSLRRRRAPCRERHDPRGDHRRHPRRPFLTSHRE